MKTTPRPQGGSSPLLLVVGRGAESAEDDLGRLVNRLALGRSAVRVVGLDLAAAADSSDRGAPDVVLRWVEKHEAPDLVVAVEESADAVLGAHRTAPGAVRVGRGPALRALTAWSHLLLAEGDATSPEELDGDAGHLYTALTEGLVPVRAVGEERAVAQDRNPRVSTVLCVYNMEEYLHETLRSTLASTYDDYEVVVVDDGSTDASPSIIEQYARNPRVQVVTHENIGSTGRMDLVHNRGIRAARGDLVAFLGADDIDLPHRLSAQVAAFDEDPRLGVCHSASWLIDASGNRLGTGISLHAAYDDFSFLRLMAQANLVGAPTAMISRSTLEAVGLFEDGVAADVHYWYKSGGRIRFRYLPQRLVEYRIHDKGLSTTTAGQDRCARSAHRSRRLVFSRRALADMYPELIGTEDPRTWADAALDIGNLLVRQADPSLALHFYDEAIELTQDRRLQHNRAVALLGLGDGGAAIRAALPVAGLYRQSAALVDGLRTGSTFEVGLFDPELSFGAAIEAGRQRRGENARNWDGSPVRSRIAYVSLTSPAAHLASSVLEDWASARGRDSRLLWRYPDFGGEVVALDPSDGLTRESVEDLALLPSDQRSLTRVISDADDARAFRDWMSVPA